MLRIFIVKNVGLAKCSTFMARTNFFNFRSDLVVPDKKYSDICSSSMADSSDEMQVAVNTSKPVYRHYRNNVANTVLSLAMGVIFAGVACIALGHFLGNVNIFLN